MSHLHAVPIPDQLGEDLAAQDASLDIECPYCHVPRDSYCRSLKTGDLMRASHWQRYPAARKDPT